jgi:septation ring formation regulator EzrA
MNPNKVIVVNSNGINDIITLETQKLENYKIKVEEYSALKDDLLWRGKGYNAAMKKFNSNVDEMNDIYKRIDASIRFLDIVINKFGEGLEEIMQEFKQLEEETELRRLKNGGKYR